MMSHVASTSASPYVRQDYISPLPAPLDAQKSPLAMLAATCNSIGAPDMPKSIKTVELPPSSKKSPPNSSGGSENKRPRRSPDSADKGEKKPKESREKSEERPKDLKSDRESNKDRKEKSAKVDEAASEPKPSDRDDRKSSKSPSAKQSPSRPKSNSSLPVSSNPTPFSSLGSPLSDPLNFAARLKTPGLQMPGMLPYACRDPFCYGCSPNMHCGTNPTVPMDYSALSSYASLANGLSSNKNLVCGWVTPGMPERCCGKQFLTSEELFAHLRTHTNLSVPSLTADPMQAANAYASYASYLSRFPSLGLNQAAAAAASRYNPYKAPAPGLGSPYSGLWPNAAGPTSGFFSPYSYYRPPF